MELISADSERSVVGLNGSSRSLFTALLNFQYPSIPILVVVPTEKDAEIFGEDLRPFLGSKTTNHAGESPLRVFSTHETEPYDRFSPEILTTASRMEVLHKLLSWTNAPEIAGPIVVTSITALSLKVPERKTLDRFTETLHVGDYVDRDELVFKLVSTGYTRQTAVEDMGELSVRGGIVDIFPPHRRKPIRLEFYGDELESIREMDPSSQRSELSIRTVTISPAREILFNRETIVHRGEEIRKLGDSLNVSQNNTNKFIDSLLRGHLPAGAESLASLIQPKMETFFDYFPSSAQVLWVNSLESETHLEEFYQQISENYETAKNSLRLIAEPQSIFLEKDQLLELLRKYNPIILDPLGISKAQRISLDLKCETHEELSLALRVSRKLDSALTPLVKSIKEWNSKGFKVVLSSGSLSGASRLANLLRNYDIDIEPIRESAPYYDWGKENLEIRVAAISTGFVFTEMRLVVVTEEELFGIRQKTKRISTEFSQNDGSELKDLKSGEFLVHPEHGIGVYRGLVSLTLGTNKGEFLRLEYQDGDRLFVPAHRLGAIQKYLGSESQTPKLDRLGGITWEKTKRSVKTSVLRLAKDLLKLQAQRKVAQGFQFSERDSFQDNFDARFEFEETSDQARAIEETLNDMSIAQPMDRLICGDVGYGKTEVALRAAFRAVMDGKQVAILVPTTLLCQQHIRTFEKRFSDYPIRIESLSRFRTGKENKYTIEGLISGNVDIVVGTHRLLQKDIQFRDLGLVIIDEEHRFGVTHKEKFKDLRSSIDVLTLTATPIPRTLQMGLTGIRDLSVINTAPPKRLAVRTQISRFDPGMVREIILREIKRGGQIFYVHNRVQSIESVGLFISKLVPEARVIIAHGKMREGALENEMRKFDEGEGDILLCTTIIESGLDLPNVNTIIVDRAHAMGLAQLYQLRGRVGRSDRPAFAYFLVPEEETLTSDATRRLGAFRQLDHLGGGFRLAQIDLEIRGAGNLLGPEQSGNLGAVGFETYNGLLEEAVSELRGEEIKTTSDTEIRIPISIRIPEEYVPDINDRLVLYKRISSANNEHEIDQFNDELMDRFGPIPEETKNLERIMRLKLRAQEIGISNLEWINGQIIISADISNKFDSNRILKRIQDPKDLLSIDRDQRLCYPTSLLQGEEMFQKTSKLIDSLR